MGCLYVKVNGQWTLVPMGGIDWPIQTGDPPLDNGDNITEQQEELYSFIQLDKYHVSTEERQPPTQLQWHPLSSFNDGQMWTSGPLGEFLVTINPLMEKSGIWGWWNGGLWFVTAEYVVYPGEGDIPAGGILTPDNAIDYDRDAWWHWSDYYWDSSRLDWTFYKDMQRGYANEDPDAGPYFGEQAWGGEAAEMFLNPGYYEHYVESWDEFPDVETIGGIWSIAHQHSKLDFPNPGVKPVETVIWSRSIDHRGPGTGATFDHFDVRFGQHIRVFDGPPNLGLPDGQLCRGNIPVLQSAYLTGTDYDPVRKQYYRQIGMNEVAFTAGVGSLVPPEETINDGRWHAQATIWGSTVGGPMIAQVQASGGAGPDENGLLQFYLDRTYTGTLTVSWSIEYPEPFWSTTRPVVGYIGVNDAYGSTVGVDPTITGGRYFLQDETPVYIPLGTGDAQLLLRGEGFAAGMQILQVHDGVQIGTIDYATAVVGGQDHCQWQVPRDEYLEGDALYFHAVNTDGQHSNTWKMMWHVE